MNYFKSITLLAGFSLLTFASCQKDNALNQAQIGDEAHSPSTKLNIWACTLGGGLLGYAQFPGGNVLTDGVVCLNTSFGNIGTAAANPNNVYNLGRTATLATGGSRAAYKL